jgi:hypothetical protein
MLRRRNSAWRRPALQFVWAGLVCCWTVFSASVLSSSVFSSSISSSIFVGPVLSSPVRSAPAKDKTEDNDKNAPQPLVVRWSEQQPGCTFSRGDDGKYRYGLWSGDVGAILAVDAREVQIIHHRIEPIFGVLLTIRYRGAASLDASPDGITMQFMKHFKIIQTSLDPDDYTQKIQSDAEALDDETRREVAKHPEEKQAREARLQDYQKSINELIEFLGRNSLRPAHLDRATPEVSGWVFFNTKSKWLGGWKAQEEFVLRLPLDGKVFEFPFKLPPEKGELLLQKRE